MVDDTYASLRGRMIATQLRPRGINDPRVLAAMAEVPREKFVPAHLADMAYDDCALPLGFGQTISQPFTVAYMCQEAELTAEDKVLEIGTGSGYGAAVLSRIVRQVYTIERLEDLAANARSRLAILGYDNISVECGDGVLGLSKEAPFAAILVTAAALEPPPALIEQLASGGRLVIPIGESSGQRLMRYRRENGKFVTDDLGGFAFVPFVGAGGG